MMEKNTTFTTILRVKKCHFHYDMQKKSFFLLENRSLILLSLPFLGKVNMFKNLFRLKHKRFNSK
jgi:hypothetical protein